MVNIQHSGPRDFPSGVETDFLPNPWVDVRPFPGPKTLFIDNNGAVPVKVRVYQASFNPSDLQLPTHQGRIDYDMGIFTVAAGETARLPIYDDDYSEVLKVTGEAIGGVGNASFKITGPPREGLTEN